MALTWVKIGNLKGPGGNVGTYYQRPLTLGDDVFAIGPGAYRVEGAAVDNVGLPVARYGDLVVDSPAGPRTITFKTNDLGIVRNETRVFVIGSDNTGSFVGKKWRELTTIARGLPSNHAIDVWAGEPGYNGSYAASVSGVDAAGSKNPTNFGYNLVHESQPAGGSYQVAHATHAGDQGMYHRAETATASGSFTLWKRLMDEKMSPALNRNRLLWEEMAAVHGGRIYTRDAVPVALTFDDYPRDFRDRVLPLLQARGLPCTIGLSSKMYDPASTVIYPGATGTTWAEIDAWPASVSVANHSATHSSATTRFGIYSEIVQGRKDLQAALPNKPIYTFMQPSVDYDDGFNNGDTLESYASTIAGHLQLGHHAFVTGVRRVGLATTCPMVGEPPIQGLVRNWLDTKSGIDVAQSRISGAREIKHGLILAAHADRFGQSGMATMAEFTAFLDWLVAEQDAGRIRVMKLEEFAIAQYGDGVDVLGPEPLVTEGAFVEAWGDANGKVALGFRPDGTVAADITTPGFDIILLMGQSNMAGAGRPLTAGVSPTHPRIYQVPAITKPGYGTIIPAVEPLQHHGIITSNVGVGPGMEWARKYAEDNPHRKVLLVPAAHSGTGFTTTAATGGAGCWQLNKLDEPVNLAQRAIDQALAALAAAGGTAGGSRIVAALWGQGEADGSLTGAQYETYQDELFAGVRSQLGVADLPIVIGQMSPERTDGSASAQTIDKAHMTTPARISRTGFAYGPRGAHNAAGDITHYSSRGAVLLGRALYEGYRRALRNDFTTGAPQLEDLTATRRGDVVTVRWSLPWGTVTTYLIEWSNDAGASWVTTGISRYSGMDTRATITVAGPDVLVRVTAKNAVADSTPQIITV